MLVEMKVRGLALDPVSNMPIIILRDEDDKRSLPIWVGIFEANAIALELEKISTPRPMTHDLIKNILEAIEARVVNFEAAAGVAIGDVVAIRITDVLPHSLRGTLAARVEEAVCLSR